MDFKIIDSEGKEITCEIVTTFKNDETGITYVVYTDGTKDENGELETYASRYALEGSNYVLYPIEDDSEWDLIDEVLEDRYN